MIKKILSILIINAISILFSTNAYAQLDVKIEWVNANTVPLEMYMDDSGQHIKLQEEGNSFSTGNYTLSDRPYTDLALVATYPNYNLSIPLRAYKHQANKISIVVDINRPSSCGYSVVEKLENSAGNSITWLGKMIAAQELSGRSGEAACSEPLKRRVSKVWFDSSYQLSTVSRYFRLDPASHKNISQFDKFTQHANLYKKYADTIYAKHLYEVMRNLFAEEKFDEAIKLGNLLVFDIRNDPFIGQYNKISKDQLEKDVRWFKTKKNS